MKKTNFFALGAALAAMFSGVTGAMAHHNDYNETGQDTRNSIHQLEADLTDLVPLFASQMRGLNGRSSYLYGQNNQYGQTHRGTDEIRAMMALGSFAGSVHSFHETWDRYPTADLSEALVDFDQNFRNADRWMRHGILSRDVIRRWNGVRTTYNRFRDGMDAADPNQNGFNTSDPNYNDPNRTNDPNYNGPDTQNYPGDQNGQPVQPHIEINPAE